MKTKTCTKCKDKKLIQDFTKNKKSIDRLRSWCKGCENMYQRRYRRTPVGKISIQKTERKRSQTDQRKTVRAKYARSDKGRIAQAQYRQSSKGKAATQKASHLRRARLVNVKSEEFDPREVLERDNYICQLCGRKTRPDFKNPNHSLYPNLDHIVPLIKGGSHIKLNTQCLCRQCNVEKNSVGTGDQLRMFG